MQRIAPRDRTPRGPPPRAASRQAAREMTQERSEAAALNSLCGKTTLLDPTYIRSSAPRAITMWQGMAAATSWGSLPRIVHDPSAAAARLEMKESEAMRWRLWRGVPLGSGAAADVE